MHLHSVAQMENDDDRKHKSFPFAFDINNVDSFIFWSTYNSTQKTCEIRIIIFS